MLHLDPEFSEKRGMLLTELVDQDVRDSWGRYEMVREHRSLYYGTATNNMPLPWEGASNIHLPVLQEKVETLVPLVMAAFWGVDPVVNVERSPDEYDPEQTDAVEQFQNFVITKDIKNLHETMECWIRNMGLDGMSVLKPYWERKHRDVSMIHTLKSMYDMDEQTAAGEPAPEARNKTALELLVDIFGPIQAPTGLIDAAQLIGKETDPAVGTEWAVQFLEDRIMYMAHVKFLPGIRMDEVRAQVRRRILTQDGVTVDVLEYEDVIVPYRTADLQTADRVTQRYWVSIEDVVEKQRTGEWVLSDADVSILRARSTREYIGDGTDPQLQTQKDGVVGEITGVRSEQRSRGDDEFPMYDKNKIHVYLVHTADIVEEDGPRTEVIYHIPVALRKIVRADYLDEIYPHGCRPFIAAKYLPMSDRWAALGLGDQMSAINLEINAIINYVNNNQELINNPFFFYEPTAFNGDAQGLVKLTPGEGVPVGSVQGILFPNFPQQPLANMQELSTLLMFGDRVTLSPLNAGSSQMKNAPQTARGTLALLGEGHVKTDMLITRLQRGPWTELMEQVFGLYQEFMPDEKWYYVTRVDGKQRPNRMSKSMMRGRYEFTFKGNSVNTNREVMRSLSQVRYNMVMTHPDYASDPAVRREALRDLLKYWGEGTDVSRLIPSNPGEGTYTHPPMQQQQENKILELGHPVMVLPTDNHADHLMNMDQYEKTDQFERMPAHAVGLWAVHKQQHMEALRAQAAQQNLPVSPGQGNNMSPGMTLAGGGNELGTLEGGNMR